MANPTKLEFATLDIAGSNYISWIKDVKIYLESMGLLETLDEINDSSRKEKAQTLFILRRHLDEGLKFEYLNVNDPYVLWKDLRKRYDHQKEVILPMVRDQWNALRFQDFKKVSDYNSAMYKIISQLDFCGVKITEAEMLEKTFSTFHASNITLQQQYRVRGFTQYSELIACLLVAEMNNEILMKNHQSRPTGSAAFPEVNVALSDNSNRGRGRGRGRGRVNYRGSSRGRGRGRGHMNRGGHTNNPPLQVTHQYKPTHYHNKGVDEGTSNQNRDAQRVESTCYRCGTKGHWARVCRTPEHLCKLYKASIKQKEVNFVEPMDNSTHLEASDFLDDFIEEENNFTDRINL